MKINYDMIKLLTFFLVITNIDIQAQIIPNGTYQVYSSVTNETMNSSTTTPFDASMTTPNQNDNYQLWTFSHQGSDIYKIINVGSGKTLGIKDGWCGVFGDVQAGYSNTDPNVEFKISNSTTVNKYVIQIAFTTCNFGSSNTPIKAFDIENGAAGAQIQTFNVDVSNPNQQFQIITPGSLNINDFETKNFLVSPNPTSSYWTITTNAINVNSLTLYDSIGKEINNITTNNNELIIDASSLEKGFYFVKLVGDNGKKTIKLVKN
jgi:hypothetical protein